MGLYNLFIPNYLLNTYKYFHEIILLSFLAVISIVISLLTKIKIINFPFRYHFISLIIFIDLYYFSSDVLQFRLGKFDNYFNLNPNIEFSGKRIIDLRSDLDGNEFLYLKSYSPFGYSQLREGFYVKEVSEGGIFSITGNETLNINKSGLEDLGIERYIDNSIDTVISNDINFPFDKDINVIFTNRSESNYELEFNLENEEVIESYLKYNPNWIVLVNDLKIETINNDFKLAFKVPEGKNQVKITYFPQNFYIGLVLVLLSLISTITFIKLRPNKKI